MEIQIETKDGKTITSTPFHPDFPTKAKDLGGRWSAPHWVFDSRDEQAVRDLCREIYGTDGSEEPGELVTIRATVVGGLYDEWSEERGALFLFGRQVARAYGRDSGAKLGDIIVREGGFSSGGSMKNWKTWASDGTIFEMRDVPRRLVTPENTPQELEIEILEEVIDRDALVAERKRLMARIAEIDSILNS